MEHILESLQSHRPKREVPSPLSVHTVSQRGTPHSLPLAGEQTGFTFSSTPNPTRSPSLEGWKQIRVFYLASAARIGDSEMVGNRIGIGQYSISQTRRLELVGGPCLGGHPPR